MSVQLGIRLIREVVVQDPHTTEFEGRRVVLVPSVYPADFDPSWSCEDSFTPPVSIPP